MQQTDRVAVLATQLAQTDRRALSEAWYSALHLAGGDAPRRPATVAAQGYRPTAAARANSQGHEPLARTGTLAAARACSGGSVRAAHQPQCDERRSEKCALARRIERGVRAQGRRPGLGSFAVRDEHARVHVTVRTSGGQTRVVAVCEPALRERVERALAQSRFALAGRGLRVETAR